MRRDTAPSTVLALNAGSSSLKFALYDVSASSMKALASGEAELLQAQAHFIVRDSENRMVASDTVTLPDNAHACVCVLEILHRLQLPSPDAIGHRVVHGGVHLRQHCLIDDEVLRQLDQAKTFAPLHVPIALAAMQRVRRALPAVPQVACFDTTFHVDMPEVARTLPLPKSLRDEGVQRFGFHGLACESVVAQLGKELPSRLVVAHLGSGASVTAVRNGTSVDTSMGMTPSGGVLMSTRTGDLDPGVVAYLVREKGCDANAIEDLIDHRSGMLGISSVSGDLRELRKQEHANPDAHLAIHMFARSVSKQIAAMISVLGGIDLLVFSGGIGEHDAALRAEICAGLTWVGVAMEASDGNPARETGAPASRCAVKVIAIDEEKQIAFHTLSLITSR